MDALTLLVGFNNSLIKGLIARPRMKGLFSFMTYQEQLQTVEWKNKRQEIILRDWGMCQHCLTVKNLDVHHKYYIDGRKAWEYPNGALITLCHSCHTEVHKYHPIVIKQSSLDEALERLVNVAQGVREFFKIPKSTGSNGKEII